MVMQAPARCPVDGAVGEPQPLPGDDDQAERHQRAERSGRDDPADRLRRPVLRQPLELQRLLDGLVVVKPDRGQDGGHHQAPEGGEVRGQRGEQSKHDQRQDCQRLLAQHEQDVDHQEG